MIGDHLTICSKPLFIHHRIQSYLTKCNITKLMLWYFVLYSCFFTICYSCNLHKCLSDLCSYWAWSVKNVALASNCSSVFGATPPTRIKPLRRKFQESFWNSISLPPLLFSYETDVLLYQIKRSDWTVDNVRVSGAEAEITGKNVLVVLTSL